MCFTCPLFYAQNIEKTVKMYRKKHTVVLKKNIGRF